MKTAITTTILATLFSLSPLAKTVFTISCDHPNLHYINSFTFNGDIEATQQNKEQDEEQDEAMWRVEEVKPEITIRLRGHNSETQELELPQMSGFIKRVDSDLFQAPYYNVRLFSQDKKTYLNFNLNYPGPLSSMIRLDGGQVFKATCVN